MRFIAAIICLLGVQCAVCQTDTVFIDSILVQGNKHTLTRVILREMPVKKGDLVAVADLSGELKRSRDFLMNTRLFSDVQIQFTEWEGATNRVQLRVEVNESWFIYPLPYFDLADRSFNVWLNEYDASLQRVNFGVDFTHLNLTGRRDMLSANFTYGFTRIYRLSYSLPYLNRRETLGLRSKVSFARNREFNYLTEDNKQVFFRDDERFIYTRFRASAQLSYRAGILRQHNWELGFHQNRIIPEVANELNPDFFLEQRTFQRYFRLNYQFTYDDRDVRGYPLEGEYVWLELEKDGLGFFSDRNGLTLSADYFTYVPLGRRLYANLAVQGKYSVLRQQQPYNDNRGIGFGDYDLRGFEYYIVDGPDMLIGRSGLRYRVLSSEINFGKLMPLEAFKRMPFRLYLTADANVGYVNNPFSSGNNAYDNRWLLGGGPGLDLVFFYDMAFRIQYSINQYGETGVFFQFNTNI